MRNFSEAVSTDTAAEHAGSNPLLDNMRRREIPSLYGLRGAAALVVVIFHGLLNYNLGRLVPAGDAVTLFFELSGLLITWLILQECDQTGRLDIRQFYTRRALRLFPVFYVVWVLCLAFRQIPGKWAYFFYMGDYFLAIQQKGSILAQAWSLGVEEKFYLLWPLILTQIDRKKLINGMVAILVLEPLYRYYMDLFGHGPYTWFAFDTHVDYIMIGCLIALLVKQGWRPPAWVSYPLTPVCVLLLLSLFPHDDNVPPYLLAVLLIAVICRPPAILNNRVARYLGVISYSLYLCHNLSNVAVWNPLLGWVHSPFPAIATQLAVAIVVASALHFLVERPFLLLKNRFHRRPVPRFA